MKKRIPRKALEPLTEFCKLLGGISDSRETPASIFKRLLKSMNRYADCFFNQSWPKEYDFGMATRLNDGDLGFMAGGGKGELENRLYAVCLKKSINLEDGFSPLGFFWALWAFDERFIDGFAERLRKVKDEPALFAKALLGWHPFPYQEGLLCDDQSV